MVVITITQALFIRQWGYSREYSRGSTDHGGITEQTYDNYMRTPGYHWDRVTVCLNLLSRHYNRISNKKLRQSAGNGVHSKKATGGNSHEELRGDLA